jgi:hypothetical protein
LSGDVKVHEMVSRKGRSGDIAAAEGLEVKPEEKPGDTRRKKSPERGLPRKGRRRNRAMFFLRAPGPNKLEKATAPAEK